MDRVLIGVNWAVFGPSWIAVLLRTITRIWISRNFGWDDAVMLATQVWTDESPLPIFLKVCREWLTAFCVVNRHSTQLGWASSCSRCTGASASTNTISSLITGSASSNTTTSTGPRSSSLWHYARSPSASSSSAYPSSTAGANSCMA